MNKAKTPRPEYKPSSYRNLEKLLGESDAVVEWIEVAVRHMMMAYEGGGNDQIASLAEKVKINVNPIKQGQLSNGWARLQILAVYQYVEWFLDEFKSDHPREIREKKDGEDLLSYTLDAFSVKKLDIGMLEFEILDYYRLIRNHIMHTPDAPQKKVHLTQLARIRGMMPDNELYRTLAAPNKLEALGFDDFILFSRVLKNVARIICQCACPTDEEMLSILLSEIRENKDLITTFRCTVQNMPRVKKKLESYLRTIYCLTNEDASAASAKLIDMGLLAQ